MGEVGCSSEHTLPADPRQFLSKIESHVGICFRYVQAVRSDTKLDRCQEEVSRWIEARLVALVRRGAPRIGPSPHLSFTDRLRHWHRVTLPSRRALLRAPGVVVPAAKGCPARPVSITRGCTFKVQYLSLLRY